MTLQKSHFKIIHKSGRENIAECLFPFAASSRDNHATDVDHHDEFVHSPIP